MNIGIVTTWFERGASYVSRQFENVLSKEHNVYIYARGGETYAIGDPKWDRENVKWGARRFASFSGTLIKRNDFVRWIKNNNIEIILFNEQEWWYPVLWCNELKIPTVCYVDYYKHNTIPLFSAYSALICNTKRHLSAFEWHQNAYYLPWGTDINIFKPEKISFSLVNNNEITFFHSCGMDPYRKGTDIIIKAAEFITENFKLIVHSQVDIKLFFDENVHQIIDKLESSGKLLIITKTISAPGLYHLGDVYIYPSRLEGIGLTIAEAQACGLVPVVTNNGPMNEFVNPEIGYLIDVSNYYSRYDGYYWPESQPDYESLRNIMVDICKNRKKIVNLKKQNYEFALKNLNWEINSKKLIETFSQIKYSPLEKSIIEKVTKYEETGFRRLYKIFLKYYWIIDPLSKMFKKIIK